MPKYIGAIDGKIRVISDTEFHNDEFEVLELLEELSNISPQELIMNYKVKDKKLESKFFRKKAKELRIALVSNYGMMCGIASYSASLYKELMPMLGDYHVFAERNDDVDVSEIPEDKISFCWKRGESLNDLADKIRDYNPDIVFIQHEWGIFPNARYWLSFMNQLSDFRVVVTMHSTFYHMDKTIVEASIPEIVVHLEGAKDVLKNIKKVSGRISVIPHGCYTSDHKGKLWNFYKSEQTFIQFGYLFKYKGFENSIRAAALLKDKYPDIFFTGLCSEGPYSKIEHQNYYDELMLLVEKLGLTKNVALIRGYQSTEVLDSYLRTNKAAVFPYVTSKGHECFGASGACPNAMTKDIPVITSRVHHFENLPSIKAETPEEIASELDKLFSSQEAVKAQVYKQNQYLSENSWQNTALKYIEVFES